jgi:hypothetical protein
LFSRKTVEFANRIEPEPAEWAESVGEGGGCNEDVSDVYELGEPMGSREFRADFRMGAGKERKP